jgi:hypothetical protein
MRRSLAVALATILAVVAGEARAQPKATPAPGASRAAPAPADSDDRPVFVMKSFTSRGYQVESREELKGIGTGFQVLVLALTLPEAECKCKELGKLHRLFVLDGERIELDTFVEDGVEDAIEPSINSETFFDLKWSVTKTKPAMLVLTGVTPQQSPGEEARPAQRTLVLSWSANDGFEMVADAVSAKPAILGPTDLRIPLK